MPIYEYRCASCGFQNEYLQKVSDPVLSDCPKCGKATFRKLLTAAGFQLKGSGWYATDFKHSGAKPAAKKPDSEAKPDAAGKPADAKPADTKPADTKPDTGGAKSEGSGMTGAGASTAGS
jgi:putative FmdB family regulatory protein